MALQADFKQTVILARDSDDGRVGEKGRAKLGGEGSYECFVTVAKSLQSGPLARTWLGFRETQHAANDAAGGFLGLVKLREGAANAEALRIARVNS